MDPSAWTPRPRTAPRHLRPLRATPAGGDGALPDDRSALASVPGAGRRARRRTLQDWPSRFAIGAHSSRCCYGRLRAGLPVTRRYAFRNALSSLNPINVAIVAMLSVPPRIRRSAWSMRTR